MALERSEPASWNSGREGMVGKPRSGAHICFVSMAMYPMLVGAEDIDFAGGGEMQQAVLARVLHADGYRVSVLTADFGQPEFVESDGIEIHRVPAPGKRGIKGLRFIHPLMSDIVNTLQRIDPDVMYFRVAGFRLAAVAWYAKIRHKAFIYACASDREFQDRSVSKFSRRDEFLFRLSLRSASAVLVQNVRQQELLQANFAREAVLMPNCYAEPGVARATPLRSVLWVGTFKPVKRPDLFIELARRNPSLQFVMVGGVDHSNDLNGQYYESMQQAAATVPNLEFVGFVPLVKINAYFDRASLLVNTSDSEGFPNTFLQSWIRGIPTISFVKPEGAPGESGTIGCADLDEMVMHTERLSTDVMAWKQASDECSEYFSRVHSVMAVVRQYRPLIQQLCAGS